MRSRRAGSGAWRATRSSQVRFTSSIMAKSSPARREAGLGEPRRRDARLDVAEGGEPERVGQPPGRVDGAHQDAPAGERARQRQRGGDAGLAHAAGARRTPRCAARPGSPPGSRSRSAPSAQLASIASATSSICGEAPAGRGEERETVVGTSMAARARAEVAARPPPPGARPARPPAPPARAGRRRPRPAWPARRASSGRDAGSPAWRSRTAPARAMPSTPPHLARRARWPRSPACSSGRVTSATAVRTGSTEQALPSTPRHGEAGRPGTRVEERGGDAQELHGVAGGGRVHQHQVPARAARPAAASAPRAGSCPAPPARPATGSRRRKYCTSRFSKTAWYTARKRSTMSPYSRMASRGRTSSDVDPGADLPESAARRRAPSSGATRSWAALTSQTRTRLSGPGGEQGQRRGDRRLPRAALPGHEDEVAVEKGGGGHEA